MQEQVYWRFGKQRKEWLPPNPKELATSLEASKVQPDKDGSEKKLIEICAVSSTDKDSSLAQVKKYCEDYAARLNSSINTQVDAFGNGALHLATSQNDYIIVCLLLLKGADANLKNNSGVTALTIATRMRFLSIAKVLLKFGAIVQEHKDNVDLRLLMEQTEETVIMDEANTNVNHTEGLFGSFGTTKIIKGANVEVMDEEFRDIVKMSLETGQMLPSDLAFLGKEEELSEAIIQDHLEDRDDNGATMLMKASFKGHLRLVKHLLSLKCSVDAVDKQGNTAMVWAALKGHLRVVKELRQRGASVDGAVAATKALDRFTGQVTPLFACSFNGHLSIAEFLVQEQCDVNIRCGIGRGRSALMIAAWARHIDIVKLLLENKAYVDPNVDMWLAKGMVQLKRIKQERNVWTTFGVQATKKDLGKNRRASLQDKLTYLDARDNELIVQMQNLLVGKAGVSVAKMVPAKDSDIKPRPNSTIQLRKSVETLGSSNFKPFRAALNFDAIMGEFFETVITFAEYIPQTGTELDLLWANIFQSLVQLIMAANKNIKHYYIAISAKIIHCSAEIVKHVEQSESKLKSSFDTLVRIKIRELSKNVATIFPKQLMLSTRMSIGVWPPPDAVSQMINEAASIVRVCKDIAALTNTLGLFPVLEKPIEFKPIEETEVAEPAKKDVDSSLKSGLSYSEYKRQNDLKMIEDMSKKYDEDVSEEAPTEEQSGKIFESEMDVLLIQYVESVRALKSIPIEVDKEEVATAAKIVHEKTESIVGHIKNFEIVKNLSNEVTMTEDDKEILASKGINIDWTPLPSTARNCLDTLIELTRNSCQLLLTKSKLARRSDLALHPQIISSVQITKKLTLFSKEVIARQNQFNAEEKKKREDWKRECLANERVKNLFQMWENQVLDSGEKQDQKLDTALTEEEKAILEFSNDGLVFDEKSKVKGGKLSKIIEFLTSHVQHDDLEFLPAAIMTLHSFTTAPAMLDFLMERYDMTPPYGLSQRMFEVYLDKKVVQIRLKVCYVMLHWIKYHFLEDFRDYEFLILRFRDFVTKKVKPDFEQMAMTILSTLDQKINEADAPKSKTIAIEKERGIKPILPKAEILQNLTNDPSLIFEFDPIEFARQMTLLEHELYCKVPSYECLDQIWEGKILKEVAAYKFPKSPHSKRANPGSSFSAISTLIQHTNDFTFWVATAVVNHESLKGRVSALRYVIQVAQACKDLRNLTGVTTIIAGLSMGPVGRLHKTWEALEEKYPKTKAEFVELAALVSPKHQYANYRKCLKDLEMPALPFLGVYLTDLTFLELGNQDYLPENHYINFEKRRKVYQLVQEIKKFQVTPFAIAVVPQIQDFMRKLMESKGSPVGWEEKPVIMKEDELYDKSLEYEPKEPSDDDD